MSLFDAWERRSVLLGFTLAPRIVSLAGSWSNIEHIAEQDTFSIVFNFQETLYDWETLINCSSKVWRDVKGKLTPRFVLVGAQLGGAK